MATPATFLLQFQERHSPSATPNVSCGTETVTATMEDSDQDPRGLAPAFAGTETVTNTLEGSDQDAQGFAPMFAGTQTATFTTEDSDQDPQRLGTETGTRTQETPDQDVSIRSYFAIPRAVCSSS